MVSPLYVLGPVCIDTVRRVQCADCHFVIGVFGAGEGDDERRWTLTHLEKKHPDLVGAYLREDT